MKTIQRTIAAALVLLGVTGAARATMITYTSSHTGINWTYNYTVSDAGIGDMWYLTIYFPDVTSPNASLYAITSASMPGLAYPGITITPASGLNSAYVDF